MKFFHLYILLLLLLAPAPSLAAQRLLLVTNNFPPYYYENNGKTAGFYYQILSMTFNELKIPFTLQHVPWKRAIQMAKAKLCDAVPGAAITEERKEFLWYPEEPVVHAEVVFFHRRTDDFKYTGPESLKNKTVGVISGYSYGEEFDSMPFLIKHETQTIEQNLNKLAAGRLDLVAAYRAAGVYHLKKNKLDQTITYFKKPIYRAPMYLAFSKKAGHRELSEKFSNALKKVKQTDQYKKIISNPELLLGSPASRVMDNQTSNRQVTGNNL